MRFRRKSVYVMPGVRTVGPLVSMSPDAKLKIEAAQRRFLNDEFQRLQIAIALRIVEWNRVHVIAGHPQQVWIRKVQIIAHDFARKIVPKTESEAETVEALRGQSRQ